MVDGVTEGEVRSETEQKGLVHQRDDGFASVHSRRTPPEHAIGVSQGVRPPLTGAKTAKMARPPHNSCLGGPRTERSK